MAKDTKKRKKMTKARRAKINRDNAAKSTGPRTTSGRSASSKNSLKHGLTSTLILPLPNEDPDVIDAHFASFNDALQPEDAAEQALVTMAAQSFLNYTRSVKADNAVANYQMRRVVDDRFGAIQKTSDYFIDAFWTDWPHRAVNQLTVLAKGSRWLLDRWTLLKSAYDTHGYLNSLELVQEGIRLLGYHPGRVREEALEAYHFLLVAVSAYPDTPAENDRILRDMLANSMPPAFRGLIPDQVVDPRIPRDQARVLLGQKIMSEFERMTNRVREAEANDAITIEHVDTFSTVMRDEEDNRLLFRYQRAAENGLTKALLTLQKLRTEKRKALESAQKMRHDEEKRNEARERHERAQGKHLARTSVSAHGAFLGANAAPEASPRVTPVQKNASKTSTASGVAARGPEKGPGTGV